jgi:hypothetical protein
VHPVERPPVGRDLRNESSGDPCEDRFERVDLIGREERIEETPRIRVVLSVETVGDLQKSRNPARKCSRVVGNRDHRLVPTNDQSP